MASRYRVPETHPRPEPAPKTVYLIASGDQRETSNLVIDLSSPALLLPGDMPTRISQLAEAAGRPRPTNAGEVTRAILDSLAAAYVNGVDAAADLASVRAASLHIVGGGSRNTLLCQLTADLAGRPVASGPAEATAIGNLCTQLWAAGLADDVDNAYAAVDPRVWQTTTYYPRETK